MQVNTKFCTRQSKNRNFNKNINKNINKKHNLKQFSVYCITSILINLVILIFLGKYAFREMFFCGPVISYLFLFGIISVIGFLDLFLLKKIPGFKISAPSATIVSYSIYYVIDYYHIIKEFLFYIVMAVVLVILLYSMFDAEVDILFLCIEEDEMEAAGLKRKSGKNFRHKNWGKRLKKKITLWIKNNFSFVRRTIVLGCSVIFAFAIYINSMSVNFNVAQIKDEAFAYTNEYTMAENMDLFLKLQPGIWSSLNIGQKLEVLTAVLNNEGCNLSFNKKISLITRELPDGNLGNYDSANRCITISTSHLQDDSRLVVNTILHESFHVAQIQYGEIYYSLSDADRKSFFLSDAAVYANELVNYSEGDDNFHDYYSQQLEIDARAYSIANTEVIFDKIEKYNAGEHLNVVELGDLANRSANEINEMENVNEKPLLVSEKIYSDDNTLLYQMDYEYDEYFYYINTYYPDKDIITHDIYDNHDNPVLDQHITDDELEINTFMYKYQSDSEYENEEYCYTGEDMSLGYYRLFRYDEYGNNIFTLLQEDGELFFNKTEYEYDSSGDILSKTIKYTYGDIWYEPCIIEKTDYEYNESGQIINEKTLQYFNQNGDEQLNSTVIIDYEYDDKDLLRTRIERHYFENTDDTFDEDTDIQTESDKCCIHKYEYVDDIY